MNPSDAIRAAAKASGFTLARLAAAIGTIPQVVNGYLTRKNGMRADKLAEMAEAMGYDVVLVPKNSRLPRGSITIKAGSNSNEQLPDRLEN